MPYTQAGLPYVSSDTSHDAAVRAEAFAGRQQTQYLTWLRSRRQGGTDREAERDIPMLRSAICARRNEAIKAGLVTGTADRREGCQVWRAL